jgi:hypothetical protein
MNSNNKTNWIRVSKIHPCPVCGRPNWCLIADDGKAAICQRIESNRHIKEAGFLHILVTGDFPISLCNQRQQANQISRASADILDKTYNQFLSALRLSACHKENLVMRGLSEPQIAVLKYRSIPSINRSLIITRLTNCSVQLSGIPGFWADTENIWHFSGPVGIAIPVRDFMGRITGIQIRCDNVSGGKYKWFSSAGRMNGCGSGAMVHVSGSSITEIKEIWITEGPLKADIASIKLKRKVLAVPGVASWSKVIPIIKNLNPESIVVAFDMDKVINQTVNFYRTQLINYLFKLGFEVYEANWNNEFKGLDDILATGELK